MINMSFRMLLFVLPGILIVLSTLVIADINSSEVESILKEIEKEYEAFEPAEEKNIVLLLGNTGAGKSTLGLLITGAKLIAVRVSPGVFMVKDKNGLISDKSTTVSRTKIPNAMTDKETSTTFYDCPGFGDSRGVVVDITATRAVHDLLKFADKTKLLFAVSHQSVQEAIGDRKDFTDLARHAVELIKDLDKYGNGMALVVTKVENREEYNDKDEKVLIDDATVIASVANFLNQTKIDLENKRGNKLAEEERQLNEKKIKFIGIFLEKESEEYTRIKILRLVDRVGPLKNMKLINDEKEAILTMVNYNFDYVTTNSSDFGYSLSEESKRYVAGFIAKLETELTKYSGNICSDLKLCYHSKKRLTDSVKNIKSVIGVDSLFQLQSGGEFIKQFNYTVVNLGIKIDDNILKNTSRTMDFIDFLQSINKNQNTTIVSPIAWQIEDELKQCAAELFQKVEDQLRADVPSVISGIQLDYIERETPDQQILDKLKTFFSLGLDDSSAMNSTTLRSLMDLRSNKKSDDFARTLEFFDFLQLLNDPKRKFSVNISGKLKTYLDDSNQKLENSFSADVIEILDTIQNVYVQVERQDYVNLNEIGDTMSGIQQKLELIHKKPLRGLMQKLFELGNELKISKSSRSYQRIYRKLELLRNYGRGVSIPANIIKRLDTCRKYISDSQIWYSFLLHLRDHLLTYAVQTSLLRGKGNQLMSQVINEGSPDRSVDEIGLQPAIESLNDRDFTDALERMRINSSKLKALQAVWSQTMSEMESFCESNRLIARGYVIIVSKVINLKCWSNATFIEMMALNKLFIDADIDKAEKQAELSILSPIWEIVSSEKPRLIVLTGKHGHEYQKAALNGEESAMGHRNGTDGLPGAPGGPGGIFLAIGHTFINDEYLVININGGQGGAGQRGGDGADGIDGTINAPAPKYSETPNPVQVSYVETLEKLGFKCQLTSKDGIPDVTKLLTEYNKWANYKCHGKKGIQGGDGGAGGCEGSGGNPGKAIIIGMDEIPKFKIFNSTGNTGINGTGGIGGKATRNGQTLSIGVHVYHIIHQYYIFDSYIISSKYSSIPAGREGLCGTNRAGFESPKNVSFDPVPSIRSYEEYARENLANNTWRSNLERIIHGLTNNETLDRFFPIEHLIGEFISLESQCFSLHRSIDFTPFYELLEHRISRYVQHISNSTDERKVVKLLYTAVISKLVSIRNQANHIAVTGLLDHIDEIRKNIAKLKEDKRVEYITEHRDNYKTSLNKKMKSANELVQKVILPSIDRTFTETEKNIQDLLNEAIVKHNQTEDALKKAKENKEKLKKSMLSHNILGVIKLVGSLIACIGPEGAIVGAVINGAASFTESVVDGGLQPQKISTPAAPFKKLIEKVANSFMRQQLLFSEQLQDLDAILSETDEKGFNGIREKVHSISIRMNEISKFDKFLETNVTKELEKGRKAIETVLDEVKAKYDALKDKDQDVSKQLDRIKKLQRILKVTDVPIELYKQNREDSGKLDEINKQISDLEEQLNTWKLYEASIKLIMLPQLKEIGTAFKKSSKSLENKSHVILDISKWKMKGALGDLKKLFQEMARAQESIFEGDLMHCIEKLTEGITLMITIYDRIDTYGEQSKLAALITSSTIGPNDIVNSTLRKASLNLDKTIQTSLVLERFESVMTALKQHKFPHARRYLDVFYKLPTNLQTNNTDEVIRSVTENIDKLRSELVSSGASLEAEDINMADDANFNSSQPFFTWHDQDYDIEQLLGGVPILLISDIRQGLNYSAVKFNEISINLHSTDAALQHEVNQILEQHVIVMTMSGNNYYRCKNRIYYVSLDKEIDFAFRMKDGKVYEKYRMAKKIFNSEYFLSPYTVWKIRLEPHTFIRSSEYSNRYRNQRIDLQLTGIGIKINKFIKPEYEFCSNDLDKFYTFDGIY